MQARVGNVGLNTPSCFPKCSLAIKTKLDDNLGRLSCNLFKRNTKLVGLLIHRDRKTGFKWNTNANYRSRNALGHKAVLIIRFFIIFVFYLQLRNSKGSFKQLL